MRFRIERTPALKRDLQSILRFLIRSRMQFGETFAEAKARAGKRLAEIEDAMEALTKVPHQGTLQPKLLPGLRCVTKERAVFYFIVDEDQRVVRVLAVFFGGQDHQRRMLRRLSKRDKP